MSTDNSEFPRTTGMVRTFVAVRQDPKGNRKGGYGFIAPDEGGPDVFVHIKAMKLGELKEGIRVEYDRERDKFDQNKIRATKVVAL